MAEPEQRFVVPGWGWIRIHVTEQKVTVVNVFTRYELPWNAVAGIALRETGWTGGGDRPVEFGLDFVTPTKWIVHPKSPRGSQQRMLDIRARILRARGQSFSEEPRSDDRIAVMGLAPMVERFEAAMARFRNRLFRNHPRLRPVLGRSYFVFGLAVLFMTFGLGAFLPFVLDAVAGDWLVDHVPFWDELMSFYETPYESLG